MGRKCAFMKYIVYTIPEMSTCICVTTNHAKMLLDCGISSIRHIVLINSHKISWKSLNDSSSGRVQIHEFDDILVRCLIPKLYLSHILSALVFLANRVFYSFIYLTINFSDERERRAQLSECKKSAPFFPLDIRLSETCAIFDIYMHTTCLIHRQ